MRGASDGVGRAYERRGNCAKNMAEPSSFAYKNLIGSKPSISRRIGPLGAPFLHPSKMGCCRYYSISRGPERELLEWQEIENSPKTVNPSYKLASDAKLNGSPEKRENFSEEREINV